MTEQELPKAARQDCADLSGKAFGFPDRFILRRVLGSGGMGVVFEAFDRERQMSVALKTLRATDPAQLYLLKQEFRALSNISHPNLVSLYELSSHAGQWFFTMELVRGVNFVAYVRGMRSGAASRTSGPDSMRIASESLSEATQPTGPMSASPSTPRVEGAMCTRSVDVAALRDALAQLADGVLAIHANGYLHRDVKPSNVLVTDEGRVVVLDFGVITKMSDMPEPNAATVVGTPRYMAPEQLVRGGAITEASDWYAVGVMLYEALTGVRPFCGDIGAIAAVKANDPVLRPSSHWTSCPPDLDELCVGLMRARQEDRLDGPQLLSRLRPRVAGRTPRRAGVPESFVGRARELAWLGDAFAEVRRGRGITAHIHGAPGIGKTALVKRFLDRARARGDAFVLEARCYERETVPFKALDPVIDALATHLASRAGVEGFPPLPPDAALLARLFPVLMRVPAIAADARDAPHGDPPELRRRAFGALRALLARMANRRPLIVSIDDVQWGDSDSAPLLDTLMRPPDTPPLMLLLSYRTEDRERSALLRALRRRTDRLGPAAALRELPLGPLEDADAGALARYLLRDAGDDGHLADAVVADARGCPLFVHEIACRTSSERAPSLDALLRGRIAALDGPARRLLQAIAVAGAPLAQSVAVQAAGLVPSEALELCRRLDAARLVRMHGARRNDLVEVYHDRIRETAMAMLDAVSLAAEHRRLGGVLASSGTARPETLAAHFGAAGDVERASHYSVSAAEDAAAALAFDRAATLLDAAIQMKQRVGAPLGTLYVQLAEALANAGRGAQAAQAYLCAAADAVPATAARYRALAAEHLLRAGRVDDGVDALRELLRTVGMRFPKSNRRALAALIARRAVLRLQGIRPRVRGREGLSLEDLTRVDLCWSAAAGLAMYNHVLGALFQTRHLREALRIGEPGHLVRALSMEAIFTSLPGKAARARRLAALSKRVAGTAGDPVSRGWAEGALGFVAYQAGEWERGRQHIDRARTLFRTVRGLWWERTTSELYAIWCLFYLGELGEIARRVPRLLSEAEDRGDSYVVANFSVGLPNTAWLVADDVAGARAVAEQFDHWALQRAYYLQHFWSYCAQTHCDLYEGRGRAAWRRTSQEWRKLEASLLLRIKTIRIEALHLRARAAIAAAADGWNLRQRVLDALACARRLEREGMPHSFALAALVRAGVAEIAGDEQSSMDHLRRASERAEHAGTPLFSAVANWRRGILLGGDEGRQLSTAAERFLRREDVRDPARFARVYVPHRESHRPLLDGRCERNRTGSVNGSSS